MSGHDRGGPVPDDVRRETARVVAAARSVRLDRAALAQAAADFVASHINEPVAVLSETVAHRYWSRYGSRYRNPSDSNDDCIGRKVRLNSDRADSAWVTWWAWWAM